MIAALLYLLGALVIVAAVFNSRREARLDIGPAWRRDQRRWFSRKARS